MNTAATTETAWTGLSSDLRSFIRRRVADDHVAEDLLQETFLRIHQHIGRLRQQGRLVAWVYQIARNVITDHFRRQKPHVQLEDNECAEKSEELPIPTNAAKWLEELLQQVPEKYRLAVQLAEIDGLSQEEVAKRLGLTLSGAKSRIQRGRAQLKKVLDGCCTFQFDRRGKLTKCTPLAHRSVCLDCEE